MSQINAYISIEKSNIYIYIYECVIARCEALFRLLMHVSTLLEKVKEKRWCASLAS